MGGNVVKIGSSGCTPIPCEGCPCENRRHGHRQAHREDPRGTQGASGHLQATERGRRGNPTCRHLDLGCAASRTVRTKAVVSATRVHRTLSRWLRPTDTKQHRWEEGPEPSWEWGWGDRRKRGEESGWGAVVVEREVRIAGVKPVGRGQREQKQGVCRHGAAWLANQGCFQNRGRDQALLDQLSLARSP